MLGWYAFYAIVRLIAFLAQVLPVTWAYSSFSTMFSVGYHLWSQKRRDTQHNVARILKQPENSPAVHALAHDAWRNFGKYFVEFLRMPKMKEADFERLVAIEGEENLLCALAYPKGAIFVQAHFGNMDMSATILHRYNRTIAVAADVLKPPALMEWTKRARAKWRIELVPNKGSLPILQRELENGGIVGLVVDVGVSKRGIGVKFFGEDSVFPAGPALLAKRTGAVIVPSCAYCTPDRHFVVQIDEPIAFIDTGDEARDLQIVTQKMVDRLEKYIAAHPDQWYIFRRVWHSGRSFSLSI
jgi:KDO2-lipid IV(A) lauroyltransferase